MLVDSHCHLDRLDLTAYEGQVGNAIAAANQAGVRNMLCVAIDLESLDAVLDIAEQHASVHASVGVHPLEKIVDTVSVETLVDRARHPKVVAIGETGLDYHYGNNHDLQRANFVAHLKAARQCAKPVIIHSREAREDTLELLKQEVDQQYAGVMHCFTDTWDMARRAMEMNFYISISGIVTFKNAAELRDVVKKVPLDRLLIETDSPYLAPIPHRGKSNEPKFVTHVAECVAQLKGISMDELAEVTTENYFKLFRIDPS